MVRPLNIERINIIKRQYNFFKYERDSTHSRGLPHIDDIIDPPEVVSDEYDSSEAEKEEQQREAMHDDEETGLLTDVSHRDLAERKSIKGLSPDRKRLLAHMAEPPK